jgi:arylsulfatase A-like enzyme
MKAPNIIFVMMDQLRKDVACHEKYPKTRTPHLDRLRSEGVTCDNAFAQFPTCIPSRASMLSGQYPHQMGIFNHAWTIPDSVTTLPERLAAVGYEAVAFGKTHGQDKGYRCFPEREGIEGYGVHGKGFGSKKDGILGTYPGRLEDQHDMAACLQFDDFLRDRSRETPFLAHIGIMAPHPPLFPPKEFDELYSHEEIELPSIGDAERHAQPKMWRFVAEKRWLIHSPDYRRRIIAKYLDMVTYADHCLGAVLKSVEDHGILDNTIVVVTSDHGEMLGEHEMLGKWFSLYDDVVRVPLVLRFPGNRNAGKRLPQMIEMIDLVPTLLDILEVPRPHNGSAELPGRSFSGLFDDNALAHRDKVFSMTENAYAVRTKSHKLVIPAGRDCNNYPRDLFSDGEGQLFDLEADPGEHKNCHADPAYATIRAELTEAIVQHLIHHHHWLGKRG